MAKDIAIIASLDSSWLASRDIDYGIFIIKTSLIFFDEVEIMDSELIDSNQMRYAFDNGMKTLIDYKRLNIIMRNKSFNDLLIKQLNNKKPMLFSSLDYTTNDLISKSKESGNISLDYLYKIFDNDDIRSGRYGVLSPYNEYISKLDKINNQAQQFSIDKDLFSRNFDYFFKKFRLPENIRTENPKFENRSDVYNYIESINDDEIYYDLELRSSIKALADIIYILNKVQFLKDYISKNKIGNAYIVFDKKHYDLIENHLKSQNIKIQEIIKLYRQEMKIIKIEAKPIELNSDVHFFVENIVPVSILRERKLNFLQCLENELYNEKNDEKLGFLKYSTGHEKYSRYLERKVPRFRSGMEMTILIISLSSISIDLISNHVITFLNFISLFFGSLIFMDGALGFIEYYSRKKIDTTLYTKISEWYKRTSSFKK